MEKQTLSKLFLKGKEDGFINRLLTNGIKRPSIETGLKPLDKALEGSFREGTLCLIAAETGIGTTVLMNQIADYIAQKRPVIYISLTQPKRDLHDKSIVRISRYVSKNNKNLCGLMAKDMDDIENWSQKKLDACQKAVNEYCGLQKISLDGLSRNPITQRYSDVNTPESIEEMLDILSKSMDDKLVIFIDGSFMMKVEELPYGANIKETIFEELKQICNKYGAAMVISVPLTKESSLLIQDKPETILTTECVKDSAEIAYLADLILNLKVLKESANGFTSEMEIDILKDETFKKGKSAHLTFDKRFLEFRG